MKNKIPDWFYNCARVALLGEIYPAIRAIAFSFDESKKQLKFRYYLDREVTEFDEESIDYVAGVFEASLPINYLKSFEAECFYSTEKKGKLDPLDGFLYSRFED